MGLAKLKIIPLNKDMLTQNKSAAVEVMYNPKELTLDSSTQYQRSSMPGLQVPVTQFVSGQTQTMSLDLFFDTYEQRIDVRELTAKVANFLKIDSDLHAPPVCVFEWGVAIATEKNRFFKGVFDKVTQKFTMFLNSGIPVRATLSVSISEYQTIEEQLKFLKFESSDRTKIRELKQAEQLWHLADQEYGDRVQWRVIADANNIENPRLLAVGAEVVLPPLED
jgi:Contractile injection system tube protein